MVEVWDTEGKGGIAERYGAAHEKERFVGSTVYDLDWDTIADGMLRHPDHDKHEAETAMANAKAVMRKAVNRADTAAVVQQAKEVEAFAAMALARAKESQDRALIREAEILFNDATKSVKKAATAATKRREKVRATLALEAKKAAKEAAKQKDKVLAARAREAATKLEDAKKNGMSAEQLLALQKVVEDAKKEAESATEKSEEMKSAVSQEYWTRIRNATTMATVASDVVDVLRSPSVGGREGAARSPSSGGGEILAIPIYDHHGKEMGSITAKIKASLGMMNQRGKDRLRVGHKVEAIVRGWTKYFKGEIIRVNSDRTVDIVFEDGETKRGVTDEQIKGRGAVRGGEWDRERAWGRGEEECVVVNQVL